MSRLPLYGCALATLALAAAAPAAVVSFDAWGLVSGPMPPAGSGPWATATFNDEVIPGTVQLTLSASGLTGTEFISEWCFNLEPDALADNPSLSIVAQSAAAVGGGDNIDIFVGSDEYSGDGAGKFDVQLLFPTDQGVNRFTDNETVVLNISGVSGLTADSFDAVSDKGFPTAVHVQSIGEGTSAWVSTPEPATAGLLLLAAVLMIPRHRRQPD